MLRRAVREAAGLAGWRWRLGTMTYNPVPTGEATISTNSSEVPLMGVAAATEKVEKANFDDSELGQDAYGCLVLRLVEWWDPRDVTAYPLLATMHGVVLWSVNLLFQGSIALALLQLAENLETHWEPATFQEELNMTSHAAVALLEQARQAPDQARAEEIVPAAVLEKCASAVGARKMFYAIMLFLWFSRNYGELEKACVQVHRLLAVQTRQGTEHILSADKHVIEKLEPWMKVVLIMVSPLTKLVITLAVAYAGIKFISMQHSEVPLILKALCMQFVVTIDELLFTLTTKRTQEFVKMARLRSVKVNKPEGKEDQKSNAWDSGLGGFAHLALSALVAVLVMKVLFRALFNFRVACNEYHDRFPLPGVERSVTIAELFQP